MSDNQTKLGVAPNVGGLLCNIPFCCGVGVLFSIVAAIVEKENKFIRFQAFQSLLLNGVIVVCWVGIQIASIFVGLALGPLGALVSVVGLLLGLGLVGIQIFMMIKANNNEEFKLPVIGDMASQWV